MGGKNNYENCMVLRGTVNLLGALNMDTCAHCAALCPFFGYGCWAGFEASGHQSLTSALSETTQIEPTGSRFGDAGICPKTTDPL